MADIIKEIKKKLPDKLISEASYEGANIVLYTKDKDFFLDNKGKIRELVSEFKKRIELRPDPSLCVDQDKSEKEIRKVLPKEAGLANIFFDAPRSEVIIEAEKPGLAIGKQGALLREIREKTFWVPLIKRKPAIRSELIDNIRAVLYQHSEYRKKFLDQVGHRIYDGWKRGKKNEWARLTYLGAARQVGRSCIFLQTPESRILLDCGIDVASEENAYPFLEAPEFDIKELDAVVLSHSHTDHCGMIPWLYKMGFRGPVYCTTPTRDVMCMLLLDAVKISRQQSRKEPLFDIDDVKEMVKHTICLDFEEVTDITPDVRLTFYDSGHILGSAMCHMHIGNGLHNLLYSGDMKYAKTHLLSPAHTQFPRLETLMIESTYGGRQNVASERDQDAYLRKIITDTVNRGGKILMPVLGSGRAQECMIMVEEMIRTGKLKDIPVYIDGMVWDVTAIHTAYPEYFNSSIRKMIFHKDHNPFLSSIFKRVGSQKERMQLVEDEGPCIIMSTSGMLVGGPAVEYLRHLADNPKNSLVFSCYQGEGSLGRRIQGGLKEITYKEGQKTEIVPLKMEVHRIEISNHSDRRQLMNFIDRCSPRPRKVIVNHGEAGRCLDLASSIHKQFRIETTSPRNLETVRLV